MAFRQRGDSEAISERLRDLAFYFFLFSFSHERISQGPLGFLQKRREIRSAACGGGGGHDGDGGGGGETHAAEGHQTGHDLLKNGALTTVDLFSINTTVMKELSAMHSQELF